MSHKYPKGVKAVYDNGGKTIDRYTVYYSEKLENGQYPLVGMNSEPFHPQGFGQHGEGNLGRHNGIKIPFESLPKECRLLVYLDLGRD